MTPSFPLTAPEALCDIDLRGLRAGAMGQERRPIQSPHDVGGYSACVAPRFLFSPAGIDLPPANSSAARFGRALSFHAHRDRLAKDVRGAFNEHSSVLQRVQPYGGGFLECRKSLLEIEKMRRVS